MLSHAEFIRRRDARHKTIETKMYNLKHKWADYRNFLKDKYPPKEGEVWEFTCPYHKAIEAILFGKD